MVYIIGMIFAVAALGCAEDIGEWIYNKMGV